MLNRRHFIAAGSGLLAVPLNRVSARAQGAEKAAAFIHQMADRLVGVVNGPGSLADKRRGLMDILNIAVNVDAIAIFCLGRFWRLANPAQQQQFLAAFHQVLVTNISAKLGEYQGVKILVQRGRPQDDTAVVSTVVERPNNPPANVDWVLENPASAPKIIDVVAEGTSLRVTQRADYASFLSSNNNNIDALIKAMLKQAGQPG